MNVRFELSLLNGTLTGEGLPVPCADSGEGSGENADEVEAILLEHLQSGNRTALFPLGQFYYEQRKHEKAMHYFELAASENDWQAIFQLGVMYYDGIHCEPDMKRGFEYMFRVATSCEARASHLLRAAQFNIGRAYFQGSGVRRSVAEAERYWLLAADDGNPKASIKAQSTLGLLYSSPDHLDLKKAFYCTQRHAATGTWNHKELLE